MKDELEFNEAMFADVYKFPGTPLPGVDPYIVTQLASKMRSSDNFDLSIKERLDEAEQLFQKRSVYDYMFHMEERFDHGESTYMKQLKKRMLRLSPFNVFNDHYERDYNVGYRDRGHILAGCIFDHDPEFFKPWIQYDFHNDFVLGFMRNAPEYLEDYLVRLFNVNLDAFHGYSPFIKPSNSKNKINPLYTAFIADLSKDKNLGLLKVSIAGALKPSKTLYDTLFLDNLVNVYGWEGKPVRWVTGPYSLLVEYPSIELQAFREFVEVLSINLVRGKLYYTGNPLCFSYRGSNSVIFYETDVRWVLRPVSINAYGDFEYKLRKTTEPKPDYSRDHVKSRSEIREL